MSFAEKAYIGTLDDVVARYPWDKRAKAYTLEGYLKNSNDDQLNEQLLKSFNSVLQFNALFGRELLVNDGYLLNHPASKMALLNPKCSPLTNLIDGGRIQILRRKTDLDLDETALEMAAENNESFKILSKMDDWPNFRQELRNLSRKPGVVKKWPKVDMSEGLENLFIDFFINHEKFNLNSITKKEVENFHDIYKAIREAEGSAPRDSWEKAALTLFSNDIEKLYAVMHVANAYYHFNFAMCLSSETPSDIAVETMPTLGTEALIESDISNNFYKDTFLDLKASINKYANTLYFPSPDDLLDGEKLCQLYSGTTSSPGSAKLAFLSGLEKFKNQEINETAFDGLVKDYSEALEGLFKPKNKKSGFKLIADEIQKVKNDTVNVGAPTTIASYVSGSSIVSSVCDGGLTLGIYLGFKYSHKIAMTYLNTPSLMEDSSYLKNMKNRNQLFRGVVMSAPVNKGLSKAHTKDLTKGHFY